MNQLLVFDIGGTAIKSAILDKDMNIFSKAEVPTPKESREELIKILVDRYHEVESEVDGIAISLPGNVDSDTGHIYSPGALAYNANTNIVEELHKHVDCNISIENDGKCAALAEVHNGNLQDVNDGVVLILGTGIGGGIIHNKEVIKGKHFFAGEVSFLMSDLNGVDFNNCFAMKGSTSALLMGIAIRKGLKPEEIDGYKAFDLIKQGDSDALASFDEMTTAIATQIYNFGCLLDVDRVLIGGGISKQEILIEKIKEKLASFYPNLPFPIPQPEVGVCKHFNDSNLIGAYYRHKVMYGGK